MTYEEFKRLAGNLTKLDLYHYKSQQMDRRIHSLMTAWGLKTYEEYYRVLNTHPERYEVFVKKLTINVSEFFRNPERFRELRREIIPILRRKRPRLRIWSAGCSNGAEAYTQAIILHEDYPSESHYILGTDVDGYILERAKEAWFTPSEVKNLSEAQKKLYFACKDELYYLHGEIRKKVWFKKHNLLSDPFEGEYDLILCRNVVIYFTEAAKNELYRKFHRALHPGGVLMVGGTEPILNCKKLGYENLLSTFYMKPEAASY
ncbi:MAG: CheR family methyltransferase [Bacillota bacterium]